MCVSQVDEPYCSQAEGTCGNDGFAVVWFISFYFLVTFIFLNIFIGEQRVNRNTCGYIGCSLL